MTDEEYPSKPDDLIPDYLCEFWLRLDQEWEYWIHRPNDDRWADDTWAIADSSKIDFNDAENSLIIHHRHKDKPADWLDITIIVQL